MPIDFEKEIKEILADLDINDGYLDCEKIITYNIRKQLEKGYSFLEVEVFLKKISAYFEELILKKKDTTNCTNYRYAVGFIDTVLRSKYWHSWIATTNL
jgi:hypothetical protein